MYVCIYRYSCGREWIVFSQQLGTQQQQRISGLAPQTALLDDYYEAHRDCEPWVDDEMYERICKSVGNQEKRMTL